MIVIGDVHGCYDKLLALLDILPQTKDICFVGDVIDRGDEISGNKSKEVIDLIIEKGWKCVLGNHEDMATREDMIDNWIVNGGWSTIQSLGGVNGINGSYEYKDSEEYKWMENLPLIIEYENFIITHSYYYDDAEPYDILWGRDFNYEYTDNKINIFGHTPHNEVEYADHKHICIDTGCFFSGKLSAIDLEDSMKIYHS